MNFFRKLSVIKEGWRNYRDQDDPEVEREADLRAKICSSCPYSRAVDGMEKVLEDPNKEIEGVICTACGCPLSSKTRAMGSDCPKGHWDARPDLEQNNDD